MRKHEFTAKGYATEANAWAKIDSLNLGDVPVTALVAAQGGRFFPVVHIPINDARCNGIMGYVAHSGVTVIG